MDKTEASRESIKLNNLNEIRKHIDVSDLMCNIHKKGDRWKIAKKLNINYSSLGRAINEKKILRRFPRLNKSKCIVLAGLKMDKELKLFSKKYDLNKPSTRRLRKLVNKWNETLKKEPLRLLTHPQHDLIMGSLLGDASIRQKNRNCSFRVTHSKKQKKYLNYKWKILKEYIKKEPYYSNKNINGNKLETFNLSTFIHPVFNFYRKLFYKKNIKTVTRKLLNLLNPRSIAIWICDDGSYCKKQKYIILCTNAYSFGQHTVMKKYFKDIWGLEPTIGFRDKKYHYLRFKKGDTKKLIKIIEPFVPECMSYKIGEEKWKRSKVIEQLALLS